MDTRKRGYEDSLDESSKRAAIDGEGGPVPRPVRDARGHDGDILFKILCPSNAVGAIIGKAGSVLNQLKELTGCKIRVSQNNEFYPGTFERVIGVWGPTKENVAMAIPEIVTRIFDSLDKNKAQTETGPKDQLDLRCLIPTAASGAIIGRGGSVIKDIGEKNSCHLNLERDTGPGGHRDSYNTKERALTIKSNAVVNIANAMRAAFEQIQTDPANAVYVNQRTSYDVPPSQPQYGAPPPSYSAPPNAYGGPQHSTAPSYAPPASSYAPYSAPPQHSAPSYQPYSAPATTGPVRPIPQVTVPPPAGGLPGGCTAPIFSTDGTRIIMQMGIPDELLGSIIGKQGSVIKEISAMSGAHCQVTQKGDFLAGTTLRALKVTGSQQQVQTALNSVLGRLHTNTSRG